MQQKILHDASTVANAAVRCLFGAALDVAIVEGSPKS